MPHAEGQDVVADRAARRHKGMRAQRVPADGGGVGAECAAATQCGLTLPQSVAS
jgi:hypothetical protein